MDGACQRPEQVRHLFQATALSGSSKRKIGLLDGQTLEHDAVEESGSLLILHHTMAVERAKSHPGPQALNNRLIQFLRQFQQ